MHEHCYATGLYIRDAEAYEIVYDDEAAFQKCSDYYQEIYERCIWTPLPETPHAYILWEPVMDDIMALIIRVDMDELIKENLK